MSNCARFPLLATAAALLITGAYGYNERGQDGAALIAAGLVVAGAWLAMEVIAWHERIHSDKDDDQEEG